MSKCYMKGGSNIEYKTGKKGGRYKSADVFLQVGAQDAGNRFIVFPVRWRPSDARPGATAKKSPLAATRG